MSERMDAMLALWKEVKACKTCGLAQYARNKVFGDGYLGARIMLVGEGPGMDEDASGHVFIGKAGRILNEALQAGGIERKDTYIANCCKCHPWKTLVDGKPEGNRAPTDEETASCRTFLVQQIRIIRPKVIVTLGATALSVMMNPPGAEKKPFPMTENFKKFWIEEKPAPDWAAGKAMVIAAYHPQYLGYNSGDETLRSEYHRLFRKVKELAEEK